MCENRQTTDWHSRLIAVRLPISRCVDTSVHTYVFTGWVHVCTFVRTYILDGKPLIKSLYAYVRTCVNLRESCVFECEGMSIPAYMAVILPSPTHLPLHLNVKLPYLRMTATLRRVYVLYMCLRTYWAPGIIAIGLKVVPI